MDIKFLLVVISWMILIGSIWACVYFVWRMIVRKVVMYTERNLPSQAELHELYQRNNDIINYKVNNGKTSA